MAQDTKSRELEDDLLGVKAKRTARRAGLTADRSISSTTGRTTGLRPKSPPGLVQTTMRRAKRAAGTAGRDVVRGTVGYGGGNG